MRSGSSDGQRSRPIRVLHVYKDIFPPVAGGIEKHIDGLRGALPDVVSHVLVASRTHRTYRARVGSGVEVRVAEYGPRWLGVPAAPALPLWLARIRADLIHLHIPNPLGELAALLLARGRPLVASYHADIVRQQRFEPLYRPLVGACMDRASAVVVGSHGLRNTSPLLRERREKVRVIRYGVDVERFHPGAGDPERVAALRARYGRPLVVAVGRLVYYKGLEHLIDAGRDLPASVVIVGGGPLEPELRTHARGLPNVHFAGVVDEDDLVAHFDAADCYALCSTSRAESFGVATAEAQAMGLPAVVTDVETGTLEAIELGETGLAVPPGDARALSAALRALLTDPARREAMGRAGRERAVERHTMSERAAEMRALYEEVIGVQSGSPPHGPQPAAATGPRSLA